MIWYKFDPEFIPQSPMEQPAFNLGEILRLIGINAWVGSRYFLNQWNSGPYCTGIGELFDSCCDQEKMKDCVKEKN